MYIGDAYIDPEAGLVKSQSGETVLEPKVMAVLVLLAQHAGKVVTRQELIDTVWGTSYGGDESLTRAISLLRKAFGGSHGVGSFIETIPKSGYRLLESVRSTDHPSELTDKASPNNITRTAISEDGIIRRLRPSLSMVYMFLAIAVLFASISLFSILRKPVNEVNNSVAVMPFLALSSGKDDDYFADGLSEEILNALAALPDLKVTARSSSFRFKGSEQPIKEVAQSLGVAYILEGSARRSEGRVHVTAQLNRAVDGFSIWSDSYDSSAEDVLTIQSDIATNVAAALNVVLDAKKRAAMTEAGLRDATAFIAFQKADELNSLGHGKLPQIPTLLKSNAQYDIVINRVPTFWYAHFFKTDLYAHIVLDTAAGETLYGAPPELISNASDELHRLVDVAYDVARNDEERAYVGVVQTLFSDDWTYADDYIERVFALTECGKPEQWVQIFTIPFGRAENAKRFYEELTECDPGIALFWYNAAIANIVLEDTQRALLIVEKAKAFGHFSPMLEYVNFKAFLAAGRFEEAEAVLQNLSGRPRLLALIGLHAARGERNEALALAQKIYAESADVSIAELAAPLGDRNDALILTIAPLIGDRTAANAAAARVDARPHGPARLAQSAFTCICGAPFDLDATPNFKARLEEAKFQWPPPSPIDYPLKNW